MATTGAIAIGHATAAHRRCDRRMRDPQLNASEVGHNRHVVTGRMGRIANPSSAVRAATRENARMGGGIPVSQSIRYVGQGHQERMTTLRAEWATRVERYREAVAMFQQVLGRQVERRRRLSELRNELQASTIANLVEHILNRLGCKNRAQIAAWAVEQGLLENTG